MTGKYNSIQVLCGTILLNLPMCMSMIYGNISSYLYSVFYSWQHPDPNDLDPVWMHGIFLACVIVTHLIVDQVRNRIGLRLTAAVGVAFHAGSFFLSYWTVQRSVWATTVTLMVIGGMGDGFVVTTSVIYLAGWFDKRLGLASALTVGSSGIGGNVLNQIITTYVNPDNLSPDAFRQRITYFSQPHVVDRVPMMFVVVGCVVGGLQLMGFCLLRQPPDISLSQPVTEDTAILKKRKSESLCSSLDSNTCCSSEGIDARKNENESELVVEEKNNELSSEDITPIKVLKSEEFYIVWFSALAETLGLLIATTYYKLFAQWSIPDDKFLAVIASSSSVLDIFTRTACGHLIDRCGVKVALIVHLSVGCIFCGLWYFTAMTNRWVYFVWTNILLCVYNNQFILNPVVTLKLFGKTYFATHLFLVNTSALFVIFVAPSLMSLVLNSSGWFWLFSLGSITTFVSFLFVIVRM